GTAIDGDAVETAAGSGKVAKAEIAGLVDVQPLLARDAEGGRPGEPVAELDRLGGDAQRREAPVDLVAPRVLALRSTQRQRERPAAGIEAELRLDGLHGDVRIERRIALHLGVGDVVQARREIGAGRKLLSMVPRVLLVGRPIAQVLMRDAELAGHEPITDVIPREGVELGPPGITRRFARSTAPVHGELGVDVVAQRKVVAELFDGPPIARVIPNDLTEPDP